MANAYELGTANEGRGTLRTSQWFSVMEGALPYVEIGQSAKFSLNPGSRGTHTGNNRLGELTRT